MERIEDPTRLQRPDFRNDPAYKPVLDMLKRARPNDEEEQILTELDEGWNREQEERLETWRRQCEEDEENQQQQQQQQRQTTPAQQVNGQAGRGRTPRGDDQQQSPARSETLEAETRSETPPATTKKKRRFVLNSNKTVGDTIQVLPAAYAMNKLKHVEYCELDYFTTRGCMRAQMEAQSSSNALGITPNGDLLSLEPISTLRPSKDIRQDTQLSWNEVNQARHMYMSRMVSLGDSYWPREGVNMFHEFFSTLDSHPIRQQDFGDDALVVYQARVRREWFDRQADGEGLNIAIINENLLVNIRNDIIMKKNTTQMREAIFTTP